MITLEERIKRLSKLKTKPMHKYYFLMALYIATISGGIVSVILPSFEWKILKIFTISNFSVMAILILIYYFAIVLYSMYDWFE